MALTLGLVTVIESELKFSDCIFENFVISTFKNDAWIVINPIDSFSVRLGVNHRGAVTCTSR
jgi:hypothetical protein